MSLNAIQQYAKSLTNGVVSPVDGTLVTCYITPPNPGKMSGPVAYVWATTGVNSRRTAPRGLGFRKTEWTVSTWLMLPVNSANTNADTMFASLIDAVVESWVTTQMPVAITDSVTSKVSQVLSVGEEFTIEQSPVHTLSDQRLLLYEALITFKVIEDSQP